jgi:hypothetical protein
VSADRDKPRTPATQAALPAALPETTAEETLRDLARTQRMNVMEKT